MLCDVIGVVTEIMVSDVPPDSRPSVLYDTISEVTEIMVSDVSAPLQIQDLQWLDAICSVNQYEE